MWNYDDKKRMKTKWNSHSYQNEDGTLTEEGKALFKKRMEERKMKEKDEKMEIKLYKIEP